VSIATSAVESREFGVSLTFCSVGDGGLVTADLADAWCQPFESVRPVRAPVAHKGQRNFAGSWWCATTGSHVAFESWLERDHLMLLDFAPEVVAVNSQPCTLGLQTASGPRRHTPDYFARLSDGSGVMIDVRPDARVGADAEVFDATAAVCEFVGWRYERLGDIDPVYAANVRWLAGYRHPRCLDSAHRDTLLAVVGDAAELTIDEAVRAVGDPVVVLPTVFHLLWKGSLHVDVRTTPLRTSSVVTRPAR
jgi:hypothetical protein